MNKYSIEPKEFIGKIVTVIIDRPLGSKHSKHGFIYECNYGYIPNTIAPDGEEIDAYVLGIGEPVDKFEGVCLAIINREDDEDDKLVVVPKGLFLSDKEIMQAIYFQERWFKSQVVRN